MVNCYDEKPKSFNIIYHFTPYAFTPTGERTARYGAAENPASEPSCEGPKAHKAWVWKNFMRGNHILFMDPYLDPCPWYVTERNHPDGNKPDEYWETLRRSMGYVRTIADRVNLAAMSPQGQIASSGYCLASMNQTDAELLVYTPKGPWITVDLSEFAGSFLVEWFDPSSGESLQRETVSGGGRRALKAPFEGDAVLHLVLKK